MPAISMFFGIVVRMFFREHGPPHFHAEYQGQKGIFDFDGNMTRGNMRSVTAKRLLKKWAVLHRTELEENWMNARKGEPLFRIAPLS